MSTDGVDLAIRAGFRPAGVALLGVNLGSAAVVLWGGCMGAEQGGDPWIVASVVALGVLLLAGVAILGARAFTHRVVAVVTSQSVILGDGADPDLREWEWAEIARIDAAEQRARGITVATVYRLQLHPSERARKLSEAVSVRNRWQRLVWGADNNGPSFRVSVFNVPKPRTISEFMFSVAPEQCRGLVRPRGSFV